MNPMYDFSDKEIALLDMAVSAVVESTKYAINEGMTPPDGLLEALESTYNKLQSVIEVRVEHHNQFNAVIQSLTDVENASESVISNPDLPINEYN